MKRFFASFPRAILLGAIAIIILAIIKFVATFVFQGLHQLWEPALISFGLSGIFAVVVEYSMAVLYTVVLLAALGFMLLLKSLGGEETLGDKTFGKIPILSMLWGVVNEVADLIVHISERRFVLVLDYPSPGHDRIGIITNRILYAWDGHIIYSKPSIFMPNPPNIASGYLGFPERDKLILLKTEAFIVMKLIASLGLIAPKYLELDNDPDQSYLNRYYTTDEADL